MATSSDQPAALPQPRVALVAARDRPLARTLDLVFWTWTFGLLGLCVVGFVAVHVGGWQSTLQSGIDYWFYFSVIPGPLILATRRPVAQALAAVPLPRGWTFVLATFLLCGLEELTCYLAGAGIWEERPAPGFFPAWLFGTTVLVAWALWTRLMMRLWRLSRKEALYLGGLAGWVQESFLFKPRFFAAPGLLIALGPLIAFTYMQLVLWPIELLPALHVERRVLKTAFVKYAGALLGILLLEEVSALALYYSLMRC